jgi:diaminopimelate decarboxylase
VPGSSGGAHADVLLAGVASRKPTYVYDLGRLRARCRMLSALHLSRKRIFFATMANDHPDVLRCIHSEGLGAFVNSEDHLRLVLELGFSPSNIMYAASNMLAVEMSKCLTAGVNLVLDSLGQIETLASLRHAGAGIGLRINAGSALDGESIQQDPAYRFGVLGGELARALELASCHGIRIVGVHSYLGTNVCNSDVLLQGLKRLGDLAVQLPDLRYIDVAGGFGVPDTPGGCEFDLEDYGYRASTLARDIEKRLRHELEIYFEPGRYVVSDCGYFFVKVVDRKVRPDRLFVGTNGSVAGFPRPLLYPGNARHFCEIVGGEAREPWPYPVYVCGNSTYSQDFLARGISLPFPAPGETLVFYNSGAYGRSMVTRFLGKEPPAELILDRGRSDTATISLGLAATTGRMTCA